MRHLIFTIFWNISLIYNKHFNFLSWGSLSVQIFQYVLDLIWGCSKCFRIFSICVLIFVGAAQFRSWTKVEETIILNLCSKPIKSNSINFHDTNRVMIVENAGNQTTNQKKGLKARIISGRKESNLNTVSVRYAARTDRNGHKHSVSARLDAVFIELWSEEVV
jgi:hypothetical protein